MPVTSDNPFWGKIATVVVSGGGALAALRVIRYFTGPTWDREIHNSTQKDFEQAKSERDALFTQLRAELKGEATLLHVRLDELERDIRGCDSLVDLLLSHHRGDVTALTERIARLEGFLDRQAKRTGRPL